MIAITAGIMKNEELDKKKITKEGLRQLTGIYRYILPYRGYFILGMFFLILSTGATLTFPYFLGELVDAAKPRFMADVVLPELQKKALLGDKIQPEDLNKLLQARETDNTQVRQQIENLRKSAEAGEDISREDLEKTLTPPEEGIKISESKINITALFLAAILSIQAVFSFLRIVLFARVSEKAMADIRLDLYRKIITLPIPFFEQRRVGELNSRISADVTQLQDMLSYSLAEFLRQILTFTIGVSILVVMISTKLTLFMLGTFPLIIIAALIFGRYIRKLSKTTQDLLAESNTIVEETFQSVSIVKAFANELLETIKYKTALGKVVRTALRAAAFRGAFVSFIFVALFGGIILVIWFGAHMINSGEIAIGQLVSFILYTTFIGGSVAGMGDLYGQLQKTIGASERIREILSETPELILGEEEKAAAEIQGAIQFREVEFAYPARPEVTVLKAFNLDIAAGEKIALVGQSGAGKSTIAQLLMRFYPVGGGEIWVDGKNITDYDLAAYRKNLGVVPQEVILFGGTIRENIAYGRPKATDEEITDAAIKANAWDFIQGFPEKMDTIVGERGIKLSGGQRQRIAIARAILKDPAILILDEATSSLDAESESLVQSALNKLMEGRTTVIIAHRLSTIRQVDRIYVLNEGRIIESGSHEELSVLNAGAYSNLLKLQLE
ncbi:MAG: ABC transporter transmembrane domain-containing protein [Bacteroidia bacterium]|nr:ABC transporter transmembrane domain-containing protein [Bacteroidia bacterium]